MNKKVKDRLISLLESGEYKKKNGQLYNAADDCHCVLGVLIEVALDENVFEPVVEKQHGKKVITNVSAFELNDEIRSWAGLTESRTRELARVNDDSHGWESVIKHIKENL